MNKANEKPTILIVDDMAANIAILYNLLKDDYKIKVAKKGKEALEITRAYDKPDLILLDVEMPEMNGYEVCKTLKNDASTQNIPIIFVTGNDSTTEEEYGLNLGALDYIKKPFHPSIIKIRIKNLVNLKLKSDLLEELSMYDGLTHIANRRYFDNRYEESFKNSLRNNKTICVIMIDVDYFKRYNDNYGHGKGDECLIKIAATSRSCMKRPTDIIARYGGEEFVVLLQDIDIDGAKKVAQNLIDSVSALKIPHAYSDASNNISISAGVAFKDVESAKTKEELLKEADNALYRAKNEGRNRFVFSKLDIK